MKVQDFDFVLASELIAQFPAEQRASSRMLHLEGSSGAMRDARFADLPQYVRPGDVMVFNDTRVIKARLYGVKDTGGKVEVMVERVLDAHCALAVMRASHPAKPGSKLFLDYFIPHFVELLPHFVLDEYLSHCLRNPGFWDGISTMDHAGLSACIN